jgi:hypothetical protein
MKIYSITSLRVGLVIILVLLTAASRAPARPVGISLNSVAAIAPDDVWAVGNGTDSNDADNTDPAFEHWDGTQWSLVPG